MPIIDFKATMCKHCYKCVRGCEVKSIMIRDGHAYIMPNRCILCGQCLLNCPQSAQRVPRELSKVKKLIERGAHIFCMNRVSCRPQAVARISHFASRDAMDIEGLSEKTAGQLYDQMNVRDPAD